MLYRHCHFFNVGYSKVKSLTANILTDKCIWNIRILWLRANLVFFYRLEFSRIVNVERLLLFPLKTGSIGCDSAISILKRSSKIGAFFSRLFHHLPPSCVSLQTVEYLHKGFHNTAVVLNLFLSVYHTQSFNCSKGFRKSGVLLTEQLKTQARVENRLVSVAQTILFFKWWNMCFGILFTLKITI